MCMYAEQHVPVHWKSDLFQQWQSARQESYALNALI